MQPRGSTLAGRRVEYFSLVACTRYPADCSGWAPAGFTALAATGSYFPCPRVSRNTPCSPNMFHTHHGNRSRNGRP
ncbi:hypothetical protein ABIF20_006894 [Bradyrhizobium japonicum]